MIKAGDIGYKVCHGPKGAESGLCIYRVTQISYKKYAKVTPLFASRCGSPCRDIYNLSDIKIIFKAIGQQSPRIEVYRDGEGE